MLKALVIALSLGFGLSAYAEECKTDGLKGKDKDLVKAANQYVKDPDYSATDANYLKKRAEGFAKMQRALSEGAKANTKCQAYGRAMPVLVYVATNTREHLSVAVDLFLAHKADINATDTYGGNVLFQAINRAPSTVSDTAFVAKLLEAGANPNIQAQNKSTSLSFALERNNVEVFNLLLAAKAQISLIDEVSAVYEYIKRHQWKSNPEIVATLLKAGSKVSGTYPEQTIFETVIINGKVTNNTSTIPARPFDLRAEFTRLVEAMREQVDYTREFNKADLENAEKILSAINAN